MTARKKLRAIMAGKKLVLMPGAYDALSARVIEAEGFEAIVAGGYAGVGSMLAQADMGQSNMRDYASHYGRICDAVEIPVYVDADTGFGGVNNVRQMVRAFEAAGVAGPVHQRPGVSEPLRLSARQADRAGRADAGQGQGRARRAARSGPVHRRPHRRVQCRGSGGRDRALPAFHGGRRRHGEADGLRHHPGDQAGDARNPGAAHGDAVAGGGPQGAEPFRAGSRRRLLRDVPVDRAVCGGERGAQRGARCSSRATRWRRARSISSRSTITTIWSG